LNARFAGSPQMPENRHVSTIRRSQRKPDRRCISLCTPYPRSCFKPSLRAKRAAGYVTLSGNQPFTLAPESGRAALTYQNGDLHFLRAIRPQWRKL
jgi:hypothetical protein